MVVGLDLDAERAVARWLGTVRVCLRVGTEAFRRIPLHHRGVVAVRGQRVLRRARMGVLDPLEQRLRRAVALHVLPVDRPRRVAALVPALLWVGPRALHKFDYSGVADAIAEAFAQV